MTRSAMTEQPRGTTASPRNADRAADASGRRRLGRRGPSTLTIALFLAPGLVLFLLLVVVPILSAGYFSVFQWNGFGGPPPGSETSRFIGLDNFTRALSDGVFRGDLWRGLILILLSIGIQLPVALGLAMLLHQNFPGRAIFRLLFFAPYVLSEAITAVLFTMVFSPRHGLVNQILGAVGLGNLGTTWLADPSTVLFAVFFVVSWKYFGFHMIIYLAGRQNIPREVTEAAATDGATPWQVFRHVTLPLLGPTIRVTIFLSVIGVIQLFDMVWVLTRGGPVHASETLAVTMYRHGFERFEVGYASAISVLMFVISLIFALGYLRFVMRRDIQGAITTVGGRR